MELINGNYINLNPNFYSFLFIKVLNVIQVNIVYLLKDIV